MNECDICTRYKKAPSHPIVGFSFAKEFNNSVAIDLKQWSHTPTIWFLHMIDLATRYSVCVIIKKKDSKTILHAILTSWISIFGCPKQFLSDNGREFNNDEFRLMADALNIRVCTTAAESPWSNGCNERYNGILSGIVKKILEDDTKCTLEMALAWAVSAKNSLENYNGFSPNQLVFGRNPNFPSCITNKPPAMEESSTSDIIRCTLSALHKARQSFIQKESCEKLRRSLLYNIRPSGEKVDNGDLVFYRRSGDDKWRGPGTVIGQENKQILVKHGGVYYRCHSCHVMKDSSKHIVMESEDDNVQDSFGNHSDGTPINKCQINKASPSQCNLHNTKNIQSNNGLNGFSDASDNDNEDTASSDEEKDTLLQYENSDTDDAEQQIIQDYNINEYASKITECTSSLATDRKDMVVKSKPILPTAKSRISYLLHEGNIWREATVLGRAGKATGRNRFHMNIKDDDDENGKCIDWRDVEDWKTIHDSYICSSDEILLAKQKELDNWKDNNVYTAVDDCGEKCISCRWVITEKQKVDGSSFIKARLVARGFEEDSTGIQTDSPTCGKESLRVVLAIAASKGWE